MQISLTPEQQAWLASHVACGEFASVDDAVRQLIDEGIAERSIEDDDLAWVAPYLDDARKAVARGDALDRSDHDARMAALLASMKA